MCRYENGKSDGVRCSRSRDHLLTDRWYSMVDGSEMISDGKQEV